MFYNYKHYHSIVLMAVCDANYRFTLVDIGSCGRKSDGGILRDSKMGKMLETGQFNIPEPQPLYQGGPVLPYVIVGDEAFPLKKYLLRPYPFIQDNFSTDKRIYNYRLSRARRTIENTFGIMASQWRIYRKPIIAKVIAIINLE